MTDTNGDSAVQSNGTHSDNNHDNNDQRTESPPPNDRDALSAMSRKRQQEEDSVKRLIAKAKATGARTLDLTRKGLKTVPHEILELTSLQYLYLEGNELKNLPDNFFNCLVNLMWLDMRGNYLAALPSAYIGSHRCLRTLLLENNELKSLPLELGLVSTLQGLNIANNPLEFPPPEVIEKGTHVTLTFLRELLHAKSQGRLPPGGPRLEDLRLNDPIDTDSYSSDENFGSHTEFKLPRYFPDSTMVRQTSSEGTSRGGSASGESDLIGPVPLSAALHQPVSYNEMKQAQYEKFKRAGALGTLDKRAKKKKKPNERALSPPPANRIEQRFLEERRLAQLRDLKEKQDYIIQKRKDAEYLREWRHDARHRQQERYREAYIYGGAKDPVDIAEQSPYDIDQGHMKIPTNEERIKHDIRKKHEELRRAMSPTTQMRLEEERIARDHELERRIKLHSIDMAERKKMPKGTPQQEMEAAKRDLQIANKLQEEIEQRRKALEYRFTAFTGDLH